MFCLSSLDAEIQSTLGKNWKGILVLIIFNVSVSYETPAYSLSLFCLWFQGASVLLLFSYSYVWPSFISLLFLCPPILVLLRISYFASFHFFIFFPGDLICILHSQLPSYNSKNVILAQISYLRSRQLYSTDYWTC